MRWLESQDDAINKALVQAIAEVLEDDIPLDLPGIMEDWGNVVWAAWISVVKRLHKNDGRTDAVGKWFDEVAG